MSAAPTVSVIMPVYNGEEYLRSALGSLLSQSYTDFEIVVIDDASTDASPDIVSGQTDPRVRYLRNSTQLGVAGSLLRGLDEARGAFIARMDADDISLPWRLERQVSHMARRPELAILGGSALLIGATKIPFAYLPASDHEIRVALLFRSALVHPTVMFRRSAITQWYNPDFGAAEDYDLWVRMAVDGLSFGNLRQPLIKYRIHSQQVSKTKADAQRRQTTQIQVRLLRQLLSSPSPEDAVLLSGLGARDLSPQQVGGAIDLGDRIREANRRVGFFNQTALSRRLDTEVLLTVAALGGRVRDLSAGVRSRVAQIGRNRPAMSLVALGYTALRPVFRSESEPRHGS